MKEINIAFIGTGIIAHMHAERYGEIKGIKVVAACDIDEVKLNAFCDKWNIPHRYTNYREMLKRDDIYAVDINLHANLHAPIAVDVMAAGKHCYCEKPMAGSYADAAKMKAAADKYGVRLHIQLARLYTPATICAKLFMDKGRLGDVYHARCYGYRRRGRPFVDGYAEKEFVNSHWAGHGALYDMGVYNISQLLYILDTPQVERVSGSVYSKLKMDEGRRVTSGFDVEEMGAGFVKFCGDMTLDIIESWAIHGDEFPGSSIHCSEGGLQLLGDREVKYFSEIEGYPAVSTLDIPAEHYRRRKIDPSVALMNNSQTHWIGALRGECEQIDTAHIALQTMLISEGIFLSSKLKREVTVDEIPELSKSNALNV